MRNRKREIKYHHAAMRILGFNFHEHDLEKIVHAVILVEAVGEAADLRQLSEIEAKFQKKQKVKPKSGPNKQQVTVKPEAAIARLKQLADVDYIHPLTYPVEKLTRKYIDTLSSRAISAMLEYEQLGDVEAAIWEGKIKTLKNVGESTRKEIALFLIQLKKKHDEKV